jgi:hypothetical protein
MLQGSEGTVGKPGVLRYDPTLNLRSTRFLRLPHPGGPLTQCTLAESMCDECAVTTVMYYTTM